jgi:hypothetical protein
LKEEAVLRKNLLGFGPLLAVAMLVAPTAASASIVGNLGFSGAPFLSLGSSGLAGGTVATLAGGTIYNSDQPFADIPAGGVFGGNFLGSGPSSGVPLGTPAELTFVTPISYLSFLWGSPDTYNTLVLKSSNGTEYNFTATGLSFAVTNGNQAFSQYVQFATSAPGETIVSAKFLSTTQDAFEVANFTAAVPEPSTWAMMILGFLGLGFMGYRKASKTSSPAFRMV